MTDHCLRRDAASAYSPLLKRLAKIFAASLPERLPPNTKLVTILSPKPTALERVTKELLREGEGWLSEESADDLIRLDKKRVWVVDPLDGTREFVAGIPEFCVSIAYVEDGHAVAGGICNPATNEVFLGAVLSGVTYNGKPAQASQRKNLEGALILASRSETKRGEWTQFENAAFTVRPMGSVAYKLALVSAGLADITFTLTPKNEWDVAAGAALVKSSGGFVATLQNSPLLCNNRSPKISGLIAGEPRSCKMT